MIILEKITKKYDDNVIIDNFSYEFKKNGFYFIVGKSGSGKTTLLNLIGQLESLTSGTICGNDNVSYVFQDANLFYDLTVLENVLLTGVEIDKAINILDLLSIQHIKDKKVNLLSGGERQRVSIARALAMDSTTILLDEPTGNLDSGNSTQILNILKKISEKKLIIMVTHDISYAEIYADIILSFQDGQIIEKTVNNIETKTEDFTNKNTTKLNKSMSFKYQLLYSFRLLTTRWSKYIVSLILCTLSLTLLFIVSSISFNNIDHVIYSGMKNDIRNYYSIKKEYYNPTTNEKVSHLYGEIIEKDLGNSDIKTINYYKSVKLNSSNQRFNLIIEDSNYEGIIITDFISKFIFGDKNANGKYLNVELNNYSKECIINKVEKTNYEKVYDLLLYDNEFKYNNIDDFDFHYGYIKMSIDTYKKYYDNGIVLSAANFTLSDVSTSEYVKSFYDLNYFYSQDLSENDIYVSRNFYNKYMKNIQLPSIYYFKNIRESINAVKYYDYMNIFEILNCVNVVGIVDSNEYDVYISQAKYEQLISKSFRYTVEGICISDDININRFHTNGFRLFNDDYSKIYSLYDFFEQEIDILIYLIILIVICISFLSLYFSIVSFMDKKSKEIFIMKSMKINIWKILNIFMLYIVYVIFTGGLLSFLFGNIGIECLNNFIMNELLKIKIKPFIINKYTYIVSIILNIFTTIIILIGPLYKLKKVDSAILIKKHL